MFNSSSVTDLCYWEMTLNTSALIMTRLKETIVFNV